MTVLWAICMAHSFVMAGEICSMRQTKDDGMYATLCGRAAQQTNSSYSQWRKVPRENAHDFLELGGTTPQEHRDIISYP
jgi:hypothetical protein